ncbi:hypothetical protein BB427_16170 [Pseudoalteromonas sp. BMB]|uniref:sulfotransferase domain-containing protein n=1 Tax=Pseudoalteromonas sp. BMB TaxID=1874619 RepID=UPI00083D2AB4|nr:sulfotransferase domain-containing protein [Pseudoalteromonas sp. BMB]ODB36264.1 hypothetical protein BB427_16170 [Pseudoalteromonas sp. BMB]
MSANKQQTDNPEIGKFFRAFEMTSQWRELKFSGKSVFSELPKVIAGHIEYQFLTYYFSDPPKWRLAARKLTPKSKRIVPDYIMTTTPKSGSSDLVSHLLTHPNVMHPLAKEVKSWAFNDVHAFYPTLKEKQKREAKLNGPVRCGYLEPVLMNLLMMRGLHRLNPNAKVIVTLRDPVDRAYSHYKWDIFLGGSRVKKYRFYDSFAAYIDRAIDLFPCVSVESACGYPILQTGIYCKAVEQWINLFGRENVMVLNISDYFSQRQPTLEKIQNFLDLPVVDIPEYGKKANENPIKLPPADPETKAKLAEFYRPYNQKLFDLLGKEFSWQ